MSQTTEYTFTDFLKGVWVMLVPCLIALFVGVILFFEFTSPDESSSTSTQVISPQAADAPQEAGTSTEEPVEAVLTDADVISDFRKFAPAFSKSLGKQHGRITPIGQAGIDVIKTDSIISPYEGRLTQVFGIHGRTEQMELQFKFRRVDDAWEEPDGPFLHEGTADRLSSSAITIINTLNWYAANAVREVNRLGY